MDQSRFHFFILSFFKSGSVHILNLDLQKLYSEKRLNPDQIFLECFFNIWTSPDIASGLVQIWDMDQSRFHFFILSFFKSGSVHILNLDLQKLYSEKRLNPDQIFLECFFNIWTSPDFRYGLLQILIFTLKFFKYGIVHIINLDLLKPYPEKR